MTTFNYPGHQRHIKAQIETRLDAARERIQKTEKEQYQLSTFILALAKAAGEPLSEQDRFISYHPSFDEVARDVLCHMPKDKYQPMLELLCGMSTEDMWNLWIWPRVRAIRYMKSNKFGMIHGASARLPMFWDDEIEIEHNSGWYEIRLKPKQEEPQMKPSEQQKQDTTRVEPAAVAPEPKPPVFTPHPVAQPWWKQWLEGLFRR